jgi:glycolate oxidase FAD binding subunit
MITVKSTHAELAALVGESRLASDPAACAALAVDGEVPSFVVYPPSAEQVAAVLKYCANHDLAVIPCRNATKLGIGNPPARYDVALSLKEMNQVWYYEPADLTASVEPGMKLGDFQRFLGRHGLWLPLDPPGGERASLGGILATNASGPLRVCYGAPRDMVIGMKIATTDGKIVKTGGRVVKNVAGYDLGKLLIGSYGTLGVIVEASFKLYPLPGGRVTFVFAVGSLDRARDLRRAIQRSHLEPTRLLLLDAEAARLVRAGFEASVISGVGHGAELWFEAAGSTRLLERYEHDARELARAVGAEVEKVDARGAEAAWARLAGFHTWLCSAGLQPGTLEFHTRPAEERGGARRQNAGETPALPGPGPVILKATLPVAATEDFLARAREEADREALRLAAFAQAGVGIAHLCLLEVQPADRLPGLVERLRKQAADCGGALVVERCSAEVKSATDVWGPGGDDLEMMRKLKSMWDPKGILSPGRFVGKL